MSFVVWGTEGRKVNALCLLYKIDNRVNHLINEHNFAAARNARSSAALCKALVIPRCRTYQFNRSFLPAAVRLWNLLLFSVFSCGTLCS